MEQVTGQAKYCDDIDCPANTLYGALVLSTKPHARIVSVDAYEALKVNSSPVCGLDCWLPFVPSTQPHARNVSVDASKALKVDSKSFCLMDCWLPFAREAGLRLSPLTKVCNS